MSTQPGSAPTEAVAFTRVLQSIQWHWIEIVLAIVAAGIGAQLLASSLPDQFEAEAIVALEPANDRGSDASLIRLRAPTYVSYLQADATHVAMESALGPDAGDDLKDLQVVLVSDTGTMLITISNDDPARAQELAMAVADEAARFAERELNLQVSLVAAPVLPTAPAGPPRKLIVAAALVAASLLALGAALLWDQARPRVGSADGLSRVTGVPTLAGIPRRRVASLRADATDPGILSAVRVLRTHLERDLRVPSILAVLSSVRGEGRSTVTALLAQSLANLDLRVAMVDLDLTSPTLSHAFDATGNRWLADVLAGTRPVGDAVIDSGVEGVSLLAMDPSLSADALGRGLPRLLQGLGEDFDIVLVDTPPILGDDLARAVASTSGQGLLVASVGTPQAAVEEGMAALENLHVELVGAVLNRGRGGR